MPDPTTLLAVIEGNVRLMTLLFGVGSFIGGIMLIYAHRRGLEHATAEVETARNERFEVRKFRRRALAGSLIASMGVMLAGLCWVTDSRMFSLFLLMILGLLSGIMVIAMIDFFSVGLHTLTDTRTDNHKTLLQEYHKRKRERETHPLGPGEE